MKWICFPGWAVPHGHLNLLFSTPQTEVNFHFFSDGDFPEVSSYIPDEPYSILCYSMGTLHALKAAALKLPLQIISIAGFPFFPGFDREARMRKLLIMQMIKGMKSNPEKTVEDFRIKAGIPRFPGEELNSVNLVKGLELLKDCDMSQVLKNKLNIKLIISENDEIVPENISDLLLEGPGKRQKISLPGSHGAWFEHKEKLRNILE